MQIRDEGKHVQPGLPTNLAWLRGIEAINLHEKIFNERIHSACRVAVEEKRNRYLQQ